MLRRGLSRDADFVFVVVHAEKSPRVGALREPVRRETVAAAEVEDESAARHEPVERWEHRINLHFPVRKLLGVCALITIEPFDFTAQHTRRVEFVQLLL